MKTFSGDKMNASLADKVFEQIETDILDGVYAQGEVLTETKVSQKLGVSRTPVREALRRLEQEGLVQATANKGTMVLGITKQDLSDIYEIRMRIEGLASKLTAERITDEQLKTLSDIVDLQEYYTTKDNADQIKDMDTQFHELIYNYCNSAILMSTLSNLHHRIQFYRKASVSIHGRAEKATAEHRKILEALKEHDGQKAELLTIQHIQNAKNNILKRG